MPDDKPRRRRRVRRPWYRQPWAIDLGKTGVIVIGVGLFLKSTVNNFDADEIKELGAVAGFALTVLRLWQGK